MVKHTAPSRVHKKSTKSRLIRNLQMARAQAVLNRQRNLSQPIREHTASIVSSSEENYPELERECDHSYKSIKELLNIRRIVNLGHVLSEYEKICRHEEICTMGKMTFQKETRFGLTSRLHFFCDNCEKSTILNTDPNTGENELTKAVVWGCMSIGIGKNQCEELFAIIDIPFMAPKTYSRSTISIKKIWEEKLFHNMKMAGEEEKALALAKGNVNEDETPFITVIVDGGWSKRSYGHGYNASSGVGIIIGAETKKPLFLGVRNKTCASCFYYRKKDLPSKPHYCALNFSGPSTGMEQDIITEGFSKSVEQHGLIYKYLIGDGDSSVYATVVEKVPYGRQVIKIECANHMTRCLSDKLHKLAKNTSFDLTSRKFLTRRENSITNMERLVKSVRIIIKNNQGNAFMLRKDLGNAPYHVFGNHENCRDSYCKRKGEGDDFTKIINPTFFQEILKILEPMKNKADRLVYNETTNQAERYMALVAKCTGGKRVNFTRSMSYTSRAYSAALSHADGPAWHLSSWRGNIGKQMKSLFLQRKWNHEKRRDHTVIHARRRKIGCGPDLNYGPNASQGDITEDDMKEKKIRFLQKLQDRVSGDSSVENLEEMTRGQHDNHLWREYRLDYLTASNFGSVVKKRVQTPCHNLVKNLLYKKPLNTSGILYGRINEKSAIQKYEALKNVQVIRCGLFIEPNYPFLGASPDGLIGDKGLLEVKCLQSVKGKLKHHQKSNCYTVDQEEIRLKTNHNYYYQIQGQLNICDREYCDFVIYCNEDFHVETIKRDRNLWQNVMLPKLELFYKNCLLPEIIDGRIPRGMKVREMES